MTTTTTTTGRTSAAPRRLALLLLVCLACAGPGPGPVEISDGRLAMGTVLEITLEGGDRALLEALFGEVAALEAQVSRYDATSEIARINRKAGEGPVPVSPAVRALVLRARDAIALTGGAFDPTVGPLVELWTRAARDDRLPDPEALARAATHVGAGSIEVSEAGVGLVAGASLDLGGIAKGAALETLRARLHAARVHAALLSFGQSSVVALGAPREARGWRLALRAPDGGVLGFVTLRDRALSVSASRSQYSEIEGQRFGHVLDPRTGLALRVDRQAVVLAEDATQAEILSTALVVLSPEEGIALLARSPGCEGLIVEAGQKPWESEGFRAAGAYQPAPGP